ncbi:hypothetical protein ABZX40_30290 [Streptomyces sp. NPDC004610]|uniref:hypothetical protein n=1 Tax=unclassified Streptomyces TaxID=2593676 RepID=UPI0033BE0471
MLAAGTMALGASPASAAPYWQVVDTGTGPTWTCGSTKAHKEVAGVGFQTCLVVNDNLAAQSVLVVMNNSAKAIQLSGSVITGSVITGSVITDFGGNASCYSSTLNPGFQRGCFGPTRQVGTGTISASSRLKVNGVVDYN